MGFAGHREIFVKKAIKVVDGADLVMIEDKQKGRVVQVLSNCEVFVEFAGNIVKCERNKVKKVFSTWQIQ